MVGFGSGFEDLLFSGTFFTVFMAVISTVIVAVIVLMIVSLIRGKGKAKGYVLMEVDDDGTMRPAARAGITAGQDMHHAAHQQALQQSMIQQTLNQHGVNGSPPGT